MGHVYNVMYNNASYSTHWYRYFKYRQPAQSSSEGLLCSNQKSYKHVQWVMYILPLLHPVVAIAVALHSLSILEFQQSL